MAWIKDTLMNRKIEGESSLDAIEQVQDNLVALSKKMEIVNGVLEFAINTRVKSGNDKSEITANSVSVSSSTRRTSLSATTLLFSNISGTIYDYLEFMISEDSHYLYLTGDFKVGGSLEVVNDVKAKTLYQSDANFELDLGDAIERLSNSNITFENIYSKLVVYNRVLYIIINYKATAINAGSYPTSLSITNVPSSIGEKIYDFEGKKLTESGQGGITVLFGGQSTSGTSNWNAITNAFFNHNGENTIAVYIGLLSGMQVDENRYVTLRSFVTL